MKSSHEQFRDYRVSFSIADGELLQKLAALPVDQRAAAIELLLEIQSRKQDEAARENFMAFVRRMWPAFIEGAHHKKMADAFERVARGELKRVIINLPPRHTKPLKDTENITMGDGRIKRLRHVAVGDMVLTHMGRARKVLSVHDQGELSTVDIRTLSGQIIGAAPSHPFLTARGWVNAGDLVPGDKLAVVPRTMKSGGDLNLAYLAGYLIGDGSIGWARNGKAQKASITVADDMELAHIVRICDELGIVISRGSSSYEWHLSGGYTRCRTGTYNTWVRTGDFSIREWLRDNGMVSSSACKKVPDFILSGSRDEMVAFLGAYFSCDGMVANRRGRYGGCAIAMTTISEGLAKDIHALLWRLGLKFRLRKEKSQIVYKGERKISDCWTLRCTDRSVAAAFLETVGDHIFHEKKTRLINEVGGTAPVYHGFDEVADVVPSGSHRCICLEVEEDHTFVASNVIVHNSEFASFLFPAWFLGKFPDKKVIQASHTAELAKDFGRNVRNLIGSEDYQRIFNGVELAPDNKAAGRWNTNKRGTYFAVGVDGAVAGKGADILVIDDPHNEQEATLGEWNPAVYDKVYKWYTSGPRQRLQPNGAIIVVMCMTGDTDVLMNDGAHKKLRDIRKGDVVATYDNGMISTSRVSNWRSCGVDDVFTITTRSGRKIKANARHPFLVEKNGRRTWIRLSDLRPGMSLVATRDATDRLGHNQNRDYAIPVRRAKPITNATRPRRIAPLGIMGNGRARYALSAVIGQSVLADCARDVIRADTRQGNQPRSKIVLDASRTDTVSPWSNTTLWLPSAATGVMSAEKFQPAVTRGRIGVVSSALTIAMKPEWSEVCCATIATLRSGMGKHQTPFVALPNTYSIILDEIENITPSGREEVFDVEVERTENFIANGVVSHNTRWSLRDLTGQIIDHAAENDALDEWEVIELPAILPSGNALWPEFWSLAALNDIKRDIPISKWNAQYQQHPTSEEGALIKREWWRVWDRQMPECVAILQSWDTAIEQTERANYSACTTWGIFEHPDTTGRMQHNLILLDAERGKWEFPELKAKAKQLYQKYTPDQVIIERRASGAPLLFELRSMGIPVSAFTPTRGNDKIVRVNAVTDIFASGFVWAPPTAWAREVMEECAAFPAGKDDDFVDSTTQALLRFRQGGYIGTSGDDYDDEPEYRPVKKYY